MYTAETRRYWITMILTRELPIAERLRDMMDVNLASGMKRGRHRKGATL